MNNSFITKLAVSAITIAALLALVAPVKEDNGNGDDFNYGVSTYEDDGPDFDIIKDI